MKLSELFRTPFKVKNGGVLNLRGFSKRVIDREIERGGSSFEDNLYTELDANQFNYPTYISKNHHGINSQELEVQHNQMPERFEIEKNDFTTTTINTHGAYKIINGYYLLYAYDQSNNFYYIEAIIKSDFTKGYWLIDYMSSKIINVNGIQ